MNKIYYTFEQVKKGEMTKFVNSLNKVAFGEEAAFFNDIHMKPVKGGIIVEWEQIFWEDSETSGFKFISEDQVIMTQKFLPDNSGIFVSSDEEWQGVLANWLAAHPGWTKSQQGWTYNSLAGYATTNQIPLNDDYDLASQIMKNKSSLKKR